MISIDLQSRQPIYEQLKSQINKQILSGQLKSDDQLPSVRSIARDLGINPNTVQKAYQALEHEGLIYSVTGKGNYISPNPNLVQKLIDEQKLVLANCVRSAKSVGINKAEAISIVEKVYVDKEEKL